MLKRKTWALLAGLMVLGLLVAACTPQSVNVPVTVVVKETTAPQVQTQVVVETVQVEATAAPSFTTPHPILGDLRNRQAIAHCTNKAELIQSVYGFLTPEEQADLVMDTFLPSSHWAYTKPAAQYPFDVAAGSALFEAAGWTVPADAEPGTIRTNANGDELALKFTTTTAQFRQTWAAVFEANMIACGMRVLRFHTPASWWFGDTTGLARRDFELGAFAWTGSPDPSSSSLYACTQIPTPENGWAGQNYMGWCNEAASAALLNADSTLDRQKRIEGYAIGQEEFAKDMPSLPLFNRLDTSATSADLVGYAPAPGENYPTYNIEQWEIPGKDTLVLALSQEPASLFDLVENAYVERVASSLIWGRPYTSLNYDFATTYLYESMPTLENGGAVQNEVEAKEGDVVQFADGEVGPLAAGMKVKNAAGEEVEFTSGTVTMQQLVVTGSFVDGLKWSDGEPVKQADLELSDKINCDKESGAISFILCDRTAAREYDGLTETYTLVPGYLDPTYFIDYLPGAYPSHRVLSDGRNLADVPAKDWSTLPEIAESPIGYGPYIITAWEKGQSMTFEPNPNFVLGAPKTPKVVIQFIQDTNQAVAQLLTGDVDQVGSETTPGQEQILADAQTAGQVKAYFEPATGWEHIDMATWVK